MRKTVSARSKPPSGKPALWSRSERKIPLLHRRYYFTLYDILYFFIPPEFLNNGTCGETESEHWRVPT